MNHIKTENGWSLFVDGSVDQYGLYMIRLLTQYDGARDPNELREVNRLFFTRDELEQLVSVLQSVLDKPAQ
jgi:hypothetical protein